MTTLRPKLFDILALPTVTRTARAETQPSNTLVKWTQVDTLKINSDTQGHIEQKGSTRPEGTISIHDK